MTPIRYWFTSPRPTPGLPCVPVRRLERDLFRVLADFFRRDVFIAIERDFAHLFGRETKTVEVTTTRSVETTTRKSRGEETRSVKHTVQTVVKKTSTVTFSSTTTPVRYLRAAEPSSAIYVDRDIALKALSLDIDLLPWMERAAWLALVTPWGKTIRIPVIFGSDLVARIEVPQLAHTGVTSGLWKLDVFDGEGHALGRINSWRLNITPDASPVHATVATSAPVVSLVQQARLGALTFVRA